jgi:hypothetical protein
VLRMTVFRRFEHSCFVLIFVVKIATFAKPENVMGKCKNKDGLRKPTG